MIIAAAIMETIDNIDIVIRVILVVICYTGAANSMNDIIDYNIILSAHGNSIRAIIKYLLDLLSLLSQNMLSGSKMTDFIKRSIDIISK